MAFRTVETMPGLPGEDAEDRAYGAAQAARLRSTAG